ncbi:MAG: radical SAM/SPASM domain-containing protein [Bdellovibrionales bacterium]
MVRAAKQKLIFGKRKMTAIGTFNGYLTAGFPSQINVDVTEFCNLACVHCPYISVTKPKGKQRTRLSRALHQKLVKEIAEDGKSECRFVRYAGEGEPLLHPFIMEFLTDMKRVGVATALTTNGLLLTEERCRTIVDADVTSVDISLDAHTPETYAKIRVGGDLTEAQEGVMRLLSIVKRQNKKLKIMVSFIRQPLNESEADDFLSFWKSKGLDYVFIRNLHSCAGQIEDVSRKLWSEAPQKRKPCVYPWERLVLKPDGKVVFCPADWQHGTAVGDFANTTIKSIWMGKAMEDVRDAHFRNDYNKHAFCGKCPDWSVIRWPEEGRSYATAMLEIESRKAG